MTEKQIVDEILRYLKDDTYNYAVLIDGEWGCGKTYFAKNVLADEIAKHEQATERPRTIKYISLYGCKTIGDVQENIAWNFAENAQAKIRDRVHWQDKADTIVGNAVNTSRKIGNIILKKYLPEASIYEIAAEWLDLGSFIFIVDDLERCECPINEVFGFFNELVEHENTKVIFFANEKEISGVAEPDNIELQYQLALSDKIDWPKVEESWLSSYSKKPGDKLTFAEIERRSSLLFPQKEANGQYRRVREKLIGETLEYVPDLLKIIPKMIGGAQCSTEAQSLLQDEFVFFCNTMKSYKHCNLRTFQFFISKVSFLLSELEKVNELDDEERKKVQERIIKDSFVCSVKYKSTYTPPKSSFEWLLDEQKEKSQFIKEYVENGQYDYVTYTKYIMALSEELAAFIDPSDPFNVVYNDYYVKTQADCEKALVKLAKRVAENKYPVSLYAKIIMGVQRLVDLGFAETYMDDVKNAMVGVIKTMDKIEFIDPDLWYVDDKSFKNHVAEHIKDINAAIEQHANKTQHDTIQEILRHDDWANELKRYVNPNNNRFVQDVSIFAKAPVEQWVDVIHKASPKVINEFREVLREVYPRDVHRKSFALDKESIMEIRNKTEVLEEHDLIKKACVGWLVFQFDEIIKHHESLTNIGENDE